MATLRHDTFTGTSGTSIISHTADSGESWTTATTANQALDGTGGLYRTSGPGTIRLGGALSTADYRVDLVLNVLTVITSDLVIVGGRYVDDNNRYRVIITPTTITLDKLVANSATTLGSAFSNTMTTGAHTVSLIMVGTTLKVLLDGTLIIGPITDSAFASAGQAHLRVGATSSPTQSTTTGMHADELTVTSVLTGAAALTGAGSSTTAGVRVRLGTGALTGTGTLSASTSNTVGGAAALTGTGASTTAGVRARLGTAALTGTGSSTIAGVRARLGTAALTGAGTSTAAGVRVTMSQGALTAAGSMLVSGSITGRFTDTLHINFPVVSTFEDTLHIAFPAGNQPFEDTLHVSFAVLPEPSFVDELHIAFPMRRRSGVSPFGHNRLHRTV